MELYLNRLKNYAGPPGPLLFIIMDGYGIGPAYAGNAVALARKPNLDRLFASGMYTQLRAHGTAVGLPSEDDMGNSEVGHNALGAGRIFDQGAKLVNRAILDRTFFLAPLWQQIMAKHRAGGTLHFVGLLSDGNVHSHIRHLEAMIDDSLHQGVRSLRVHALLDGRDVGEKSALDFIGPLEQRLADINRTPGVDYRIASGGGRMHVTMDRYNADWEVVKRGYEAHVLGIGRNFGAASDAVRAFYSEDPRMTDQYMAPFVVCDEHGPVGRVLDGDSMIFFNFRGDRAIEFSRAMTEPDFHEFDRPQLPDVLFAGMMEYDGDLRIPENYLVNPPNIDSTISQYLCAEQITSFAISETQKYGHVTYFWNGNNSGYIDNRLERYVEIPSDRIEFDKKPMMKAKEITAGALAMLDEKTYRFGRINFPNGDMVGHTGNFDAAVAAIETVDACVGELADKVLELQGILIITADHGNADEMFTEKDGVRTPASHTLNPVPFCIVDGTGAPRYSLAPVKSAGLANVAATLLNLLGFEAPQDYEPSLVSFDQGAHEG